MAWEVNTELWAAGLGVINDVTDDISGGGGLSLGVSFPTDDTRARSNGGCQKTTFFFAPELRLDMVGIDAEKGRVSAAAGMRLGGTQLGEGCFKMYYPLWSFSIGALGRYDRSFGEHVEYENRYGVDLDARLHVSFTEDFSLIGGVRSGLLFSGDASDISLDIAPYIGGAVRW